MEENSKSRGKREEIEEIKKKITETKRQLLVQPISTKRIKELNQELETIQRVYKSLRYTDTRVYSESCAKWRDGFLGYLQRIKSHDPKRGVAMAFDVLNPYISARNDSSLKYDELEDPLTVRYIIEEFIKSDLKSATKLKYISFFQLMVEFLMVDLESPEKKTDLSVNEILHQDIKLKAIKKEIGDVTKRLLKQKGVDRIETNKVAKQKLFSEEEVAELKQKLNMNFSEFLALEEEKVYIYIYKYINL